MTPVQIFFFFEGKAGNPPAAPGAGTPIGPGGPRRPGTVK